jgi:predicted DNA-binding transcriptional regulator AlpA
MTTEVLNTEKVKHLRQKKGLTNTKWIIQRIGLKESTGYDFLRDGKLPKNPSLRRKALKELSKLLETDESKLVLRLVPARTAS